MLQSSSLSTCYHTGLDYLAITYESGARLNPSPTIHLYQARMTLPDITIYAELMMIVNLKCHMPGGSKGRSDGLALIGIYWAVIKIYPNLSTPFDAIVQTDCLVCNTHCNCYS